MPHTFIADLNRGFHEPKRTGDRLNVWGLVVRDCAYKLDAMDLPEEAGPVLRELFEEMGRLTRDGHPN